MNIIYDNFLTNMLEKLTEKVETFIQVKHNEIITWGNQENINWNELLTNLLIDIEKSIYNDAQRQLKRDQQHQIAQSWRDFNLTSDIEDIEKKNTINQIKEAKKLCDTEKKFDSRMLQVYFHFHFFLLKTILE